MQVLGTIGIEDKWHYLIFSWRYGLSITSTLETASPTTARKYTLASSEVHPAKVLGLKGQVLIGDAALKYHLDGGEGLDLAEEWYNKTSLPFVFARLCYNKHGKSIEKLAKTFAQTKVKIPQYILKREAEKRGISPKELTWYLEHIYYKMDWKAKRSLKLFLKQSSTSL